MLGIVCGIIVAKNPYDFALHILISEYTRLEGYVDVGSTGLQFRLGRREDSIPQAVRYSKNRIHAQTHSFQKPIHDLPILDY